MGVDQGPGADLPWAGSRLPLLGRKPDACTETHRGAPQPQRPIDQLGKLEHASSRELLVALLGPAPGPIVSDSIGLAGAPNLHF